MECYACDGTGIDEDGETCHLCNGTGLIDEDEDMIWPGDQ